MSIQYTVLGFHPTTFRFFVILIKLHLVNVAL